MKVSEFPKKINFGTHEKSCNLRCPKCLMHGESERGNALRKSLGDMPLDALIRVFDEVKESRPMVSPSFWSEPLLAKIFRDFVVEAKKRYLPIMINTNALLIKGDMAQFLVDHLDVVSVSIDATTEDTLELTRSTRKLEFIQNAVFELLERRGDNKKPRIVVSFSAEEENIHEQEDFIAFWIRHVDAIRTNEIYDSDRKIGRVSTDIERYPCREIYDQMTIDYDGEARLCCLDAYRETSLGNVFREGLYNVWHGEKYQEVRRVHESGDYSTYPFCASCDQWAGFNILEEEEKNGVLIRRSKFSTYLNRVDRLETWDGQTRRADG